MRRGVFFFLLGVVILVTFALHAVSTLLSLLIEDASADAIHHAEIPAPNSSVISRLPQLIPKIIHQTYINDSIPDRWIPAQIACLDLHPDYEYRLWTDAKSRNLIEKEYPWFLDTFDGYDHPIQRADAIRYFVLSHYGGIYIDLDQGCKRRLDPLLAYPAWLRRTIPTGISNDIMGSIPQHPFFLRVIESLQGADRKWVLPYITIMASTGPLFLSVIWKKYMDEHADMSAEDEAWSGRVRVLLPDDTSKHDWSFFVTYKGSSWHGSDARLIFWMGKNWLLITVVGFALAGLVGFGLWWLYGRILQLAAKRKHYGSPRTMSRRNGGVVPGSPMPFWRMFGFNAGETWAKTNYEMVAQHDA